MLHISLFSGVGGFDLAAQWMGWKNIVSCEINEFGNKHLEFYWPEAYHHRDIHTLDYATINAELSKRFGTDWRNDDIILSGGFPCQPYSTAGKRLGKEDERHLWPQMCRVIREVRPKWIVGENVFGLVNWNGGLVFHEVQADLEAEGYEVQPYVLPAAGVGAPHKRDRIFFIAYSASAGIGQKHEFCTSGNLSEKRIEESRTASDTNSSTKRTPRQSGGTESKRSADDVQLGEWGGEAEQHTGSSAFQRTTPNTVSGEREERLQNTSGGEDREENKAGLDNRTKRFGGEWSIADTSSSRLQADNSLRKSEGEINCAGMVSEEFSPNSIEHGNGINPKYVENDYVADTNSDGVPRQPINPRTSEEIRQGRESFTQIRDFGCAGRWENFPTQSPICHRDDELSDRLVGITFSKWRAEAIKAMGNAVVPTLILQIFKAIQQYEDLEKAGKL